MLHLINDTLIRTAAHPIVTDVTLASGFLKQPKPDSKFPGVKEANALAGGFTGLALIACVIALIIGVVLVVFGKIAKHGAALTGGVITIIVAIIGAAVLAQSAGYITFGWKLA